MAMATFFIQDIFRIAGVGIVITGQVKSGTLTMGMKLDIGKIMEIKSMEMHNMSAREAHEGDNVGIVLSNADFDLIKNYVRKEVKFF